MFLFKKTKQQKKPKNNSMFFYRDWKQIRTCLYNKSKQDISTAQTISPTHTKKLKIN